jgi:hypothetical protein
MNRIACAILVTLAAAASGCNYAAPAAWLLQGPAKKVAEYTLPKDRKTVVFVDDRKSVVSRLQLRSQLADDVSMALRDEGLVTNIQSGRELIAYVRRNETSTRRVSIEELGAAAGAEVVVYVEMQAFDLTPDGATPKPTATARVKVVDVKAKERLFPTAGGDNGGFEVTVDMDAFSADAYRTSASRRRMEDALEKKLADHLAKVFYEHDPNGFGKGVANPEK